MSARRLTIRLGEYPQIDVWLRDLGGSQADTARALMTVGAAALGLPGVAREARRLGLARLAPRLLVVLDDVAATRQPPGSHPAATVPEAAPVPVPSTDPFAEVGIEV